ncbi:UPF0126 domain-containing protein [Hyaloraphidium curvatum]|nr:UPF0126 domain-containing protein [Hyaloraphidium curvatum]
MLRLAKNYAGPLRPSLFRPPPGRLDCLPRRGTRGAVVPNPVSFARPQCQTQSEFLVYTRLANASPNQCSVPPSSGSRSLSSAPPPAHPDSMPRYPNASIRGLLRASDYIGTSVFACTGAVTAGSVANMDILGCVLVGTITAVGGGTVRDLLIGNRPFWNEEPEYIYISVVTAGATFMLWKLAGLEDDDPLINWGDALGVGAFAVIGTLNGIRKGLPALLCMFCGMSTATFGGVIRDVLSQRRPRILHSYAELYATTALAGSGVYLAARALAVPVPVRIVMGVGTAMGARWAAWTWDLRLPTWNEVNGPDRRVAVAPS